VIERDDPVLALLPDDDDLPDSFRLMPQQEQAWRGRLMLMTWLVTDDETYAWSVALADSEPHNTESRELVASVADSGLISEVALHPLRE
jgi:hypothetical protein